MKGRAVGGCMFLLLAGAALNDCRQGVPANAERSASTVPADLAAIKAIQTEVLRGYKEHNLALISAHHAPDMVLIVPGRPPIFGKEAADRNTAAELAPGSWTDFNSNKVQIARSGDLAYSRGTYRFGYVDPRTKRKLSGSGSFITVFVKKADGKWVVSEEISSPDSDS